MTYIRTYKIKDTALSDCVLGVLYLLNAAKYNAHLFIGQLLTPITLGFDISQHPADTQLVRGLLNLSPLSFELLNLSIMAIVDLYQLVDLVLVGLLAVHMILDLLINGIQLILLGLVRRAGSLGLLGLLVLLTENVLGLILVIHGITSLIYCNPIITHINQVSIALFQNN